MAPFRTQRPARSSTLRLGFFLLTAVLAAGQVVVGGEAPSPVDSDLPRYRPDPAVSGKIAASGGELMEAWAQGFMRLNPRIAVSVSKPAATSMDDLRSLFAGRFQIVGSGFQRELAFQKSLGQKQPGPDPIAVAVSSGGTAFHPDMPEASPALAFFVNAENPLTRLTLTQLDAIFSRTRRRGYPEDIVTWGQLGLTGEWARQPIHRYGMSLHNQYGYPHGYIYFLSQRVMNGGEFKPDLVQVPDTAYGHGKNLAFAEIMADVAKDRNAIAFAPFEFRAAGTKSLALAENASSPFFAGTRDEVARRCYPLTMTNYVSVRRTAGRALDPAVRQFLLYVLSREGQQVIADTPGHILPLTAAFAAEERARLR